MRPRAEWAIDSEAMRASKIQVKFTKIQLVGKKIPRKNMFHKLKLEINPFLPPKHYKYDRRFSLLEGYNI